MNVKVFAIRSIRKSSHITRRVFSKGLHFSARVEDKTTRILNGVDFSVKTSEEIPFEKAFFHGIPFNIAPLNPALPAVGRKGAVTLLIPSLNKGSFFGGTATALILAGKFAVEKNMPLRIIETLSSGGKKGLGSFFADQNIPIDEESVELLDVSGRTYKNYGYIDLHPDDLFIASAWWDAHLLDQLPLSKKYIYLIQDYEPIFYANGDTHVLAENTYHSKKFIPVCNTELMYNFMATKYPYIKKNGLWFEPAVSLIDKGKSIENKKSKKKIFLYGRPNVERNLFYTGLDALNHVFNETLDCNEWEIFMAGQDKLPTITLSSGIKVTNLGKMSIDKYHDFARTVDVTVSLMMAPHPNYPTLELSSIGSMVVTTKYENKQDLSNYSGNIIMADLSAGSIASAIEKAAQVPYNERVKNTDTSNIERSWDKTLGKTIASLKEVL